MIYQTEFLPAWHPTKAEVDQLNAAGLTDISWHTEECPSWAYIDSDDETTIARIWVDAIDSGDRVASHRDEDEAAPRFATVGGEEGEDLLYEGENLDEAIAQAQRYRDRILETQQAESRKSRQLATTQQFSLNLAVLAEAIQKTAEAMNDFVRAFELADPEPCLLDEALRLLDLDEAAKLLQDALGVETRDLADVMLSGLDPEHDDEATIREALREYLNREINMMTDEAVRAALRRNEGPDYDAPAGRDWLFRFLTGLK